MGAKMGKKKTVNENLKKKLVRGGARFDLKINWVLIESYFVGWRRFFKRLAVRGNFDNCTCTIVTWRGFVLQRLGVLSVSCLRRTSRQLSFSIVISQGG